MAGVRKKRFRPIIAGLILAAGESKRFGRPKALAQFGSQTALSLLVGAARAAKLDPLFVIVGHHAEDIREECRSLGVRAVVNDEWKWGQLSSLQAGLRALSSSVQAVAMFLVDHPLVPEETIKQLIRSYKSDPSKVYRPVVGRKGGHPALFPRLFFDELLRLDPREKSARDVFFKPGRCVDLKVEDAGATLEFDTEEGYRGLQRIYGQKKSDKRQNARKEVSLFEE
ncbi:MAG TPA: nucleotidyltransferase family protein [Bdellovibrionota bacterium]|nr:nucleotidyltransferase family protein [Bdellovibrionota bacterium]